MFSIFVNQHVTRLSLPIDRMIISWRPCALASCSVTSCSPCMQTNMNFVFTIKIILDFGSIARAIIATPITPLSWRTTIWSIIVEYKVPCMMPTFDVIGQSIIGKVLIEIIDVHVEESIFFIERVAKFRRNSLSHVTVTIRSSIPIWVPRISQLDKPRSISKLHGWQYCISMIENDSLRISYGIPKRMIKCSTNHHSLHVFRVILAQICPYFIRCLRCCFGGVFLLTRIIVTECCTVNMLWGATIHSCNTVSQISTFDPTIISMEFGESFFNERSPNRAIITNFRKPSVSSWRVAPALHWNHIINGYCHWDVERIHIDSIHSCLRNFLV